MPSPSSAVAGIGHYILPVRTQFEKVEATGFIPQCRDDTLPELEIYTRLLEAMGAIPPRFPALQGIARHQPKVARY